MREWRATDVLPEVNAVLSAAQLSSRGCIYFSKRPEKKREQRGRQNEEGKRGGRGENRRADRDLERKEPGKRCSVALECFER